MSALAEGWYADPLGRYERRFWDGSQWTAKVRTGETEQVDPLGVSTSIPFAIPATAYSDDAATKRRRRRWMLIGLMVLVDIAVLVTIAVLIF